MAKAKPLLEGHRRFAWFEPARKGSPSEYESYTLGQQSSPQRGLHVDWPVRFDDGREPFTEPHQQSAAPIGRAIGIRPKPGSAPT